MKKKNKTKTNTKTKTKTNTNELTRINGMSDSEIKAWANQEVIIKCNMGQAGDLMDILFMADSRPLNDDFNNTLRLNKMTKAYNRWLNRMVAIVCADEIENAEKRKRVDNKKKR